MSETAIASCRASVMVFNEQTKKWIPAGESATQGLAKVQIYQHNVNYTFRVVGRKVQDHEVVLNCAIVRGLKYNQATPTFHQWRDQRQVYGLNFASADDAANFAQVMMRAIDAVNHPMPPNASSAEAVESSSMAGGYTNGGGVLHQQHIAAALGPHHAASSPNFGASNGTPMHYQQQTSNASYDYDDGGASDLSRQHSQQSNYRKTSDNYQNHARRASQGSCGSAGATSNNSSSNLIYSSTNVTVGGQSPQRPAPVLPPSQKPAPMAGTTGGGAPPPPPPPPPPVSALKLDGGKAGGPAGNTPSGLAAALQQATLRKTSQPNVARAQDTNASSSGRPERTNSIGSIDSQMSARTPATPGGGGGGGLLSDLQRTLEARRRKTEAGENGATPKASDSPVRAESTKKPWEHRNGRLDSTPANESPRTHRKMPSGSSLSSQEEAATKQQLLTAGHNASASAVAGGGGGAVTHDQLEAWKHELLLEVRKEIQAAKADIIEVLRQELNRR